jgi:hypothetical protein
LELYDLLVLIIIMCVPNKKATHEKLAKQRGEKNTRSPDKPRTTMTPARRGRRSHRDEGDDASGIVGA